MIEYREEDYAPLKIIERIFIEKSEIDRPEIKALQEKIPKLLPAVQDISLIDDFQCFYEQKKASFKRSFLFLVKNRGQFLKPCPGTKNHICCLYRVLDIANNCYFDCRYCILQSYFPVRSVILYTNTEKIAEELAYYDEHSSGARFGTGQFTDSLLMEPLYSQTEKIISIFEKYPHQYLELKTKSVFINHLIPHVNRNIILSWSLNTPRVINEYEENTASLDRRLEAAQAAALAGFPLSFHFDPIITYPEWKEEYARVIENIFACIQAESILYISLGCLRYTPELKKILLEKGKECSFLFEPAHRGKDGKMRYFFYQRKEVYDFFLDKIEEYAPEMLVYFCMERSEIWKLSTKESMTTKKLGERLYQRTREFFVRRDG